MSKPFPGPEDDMFADAMTDTANLEPDQDLSDLVGDNPWLRALEPFYIEWELIWMM